MCRSSPANFSGSTHCILYTNRTKNCCTIEAMHVLRRKLRKDLELFRNVSVHEFYRLKALITLEEVNTSEWSKKNKNLN